MTRRVAHDGAGKLEISFDYDPELVEYVKTTVPRRAWNRDQRVWTAPETEVVAVVEALRPEGFAFDAATLALYDARAGDEPDHFTVTRLNQAAQRAMRGAFPEPVWLVGQLNDIDKAIRRAETRGERAMLFFKLVEVDETGKEVASVGCKVTARVRTLIASKIARAGNPLTLTDETTVRLRGQVELYVPRGSYQLDITDIDVNYTLGEVARRREAIKRTLIAEGVLEQNRQRALPVLPLRIGLVTSLESEAYNDVLKTLRESGFAFSVLAHDARVQGSQTEPTVLSALAYFAAYAAELDVVLICRGGGSRTDLAWFDTEALGRAVATFPLPVLVGIGHETDEGVMDDVGWSHKTPTAAAAFLVDRVALALAGVEDRAYQIALASQRRIQEQRHRLDGLGRQLAEAVRGRLRLERQRVAARSERLVAGTRHRLDRARAGLRHSGHAIHQGASHLLSRRRAEVDVTAERVGRESRRLLVRATERLGDRAVRLRLVNPDRVLERGYALLRRADGQTLRTITDAPAGTQLSARLSDGRLSL
ncbi:MAG: exodeoxyribonuclease VII large subunit, partial [Myxococcota bacterium]|nr:exodeoxyribonuclease VII large subunit [Myxococcota bacterium]